MTGPEHKAEAERLIKAYHEGLDLMKHQMVASGSMAAVAPSSEILANGLALAQVHATLALVDTVQTAARGHAEAIGNTINRVASRKAGAW